VFDQIGDLTLHSQKIDSVRSWRSDIKGCWKLIASDWRSDTTKPKKLHYRIRKLTVTSVKASTTYKRHWQ